MNDIAKIKLMIPCLYDAIKRYMPRISIDGIILEPNGGAADFSHVLIVTTITRINGYVGLYETTGHRLYIKRETDGAIKTLCKYYAYLGDPHCSEAKWPCREYITNIINYWWTTVSHVLDAHKHAQSQVALIKEELMMRTHFHVNMINQPLH